MESLAVNFPDIHSIARSMVDSVEQSVALRESSLFGSSMVFIGKMNGRRREEHVPV